MHTNCLSPNTSTPELVNTSQLLVTHHNRLQSYARSHQSLGSINVVQQQQGWYAPRNNVNNTSSQPPRTPTQPYTPTRQVDNRPSWLTNTQSPGPTKRVNFADNEQDIKDEPNHKQGRLCVVSAGIFLSNLARERIIRQMPLDLDNGLPGILLRVGKDHSTSTCFLCHVDSCAAMNTGNLLLHQYIMTTYPETVAEYIQYNDKEPFEPIRLECAVQDLERVENEQGKLTAIVRYLTPYTDTENKPILISFGLGSGVAVRSILGKPTLKAWQCVIDFGSNKLIAPTLQRRFNLEYEEAQYGLPDGIEFQKTDFQRPLNTSPSDNQSNGSIMCAITDGSHDEPTVTVESENITDDQSLGYLCRSVKLNHL